MGEVKIIIDNKEVRVPEGTTILKAAEKAQIKIPTLCYLEWIKHDVGACRVCVVEVESEDNLVTACNTLVRDGMVIKTNTPKVREARKLQLELMLSEHHLNCPTCPRNGNCELQSLAAQLNIKAIRPQEEEKVVWEVDDSSPALVRNPNKCIVCQRCITMCKEVQTVNALDIYGTGINAIVKPLNEKPLIESPCVFCGQCSIICPVAAIVEKDDIEKVWEALSNPELHVVVQTAPATHVTIGEAFDFLTGADITGKLVSALKTLGFDAVFDTNWSADLTICEEGVELIGRIVANKLNKDSIEVSLFGKKINLDVTPFKNKPLPQFTSCCPSWVKFIEQFYPEFLEHVSSCKSPQQMLGPIAKVYYAQKKGISPEKVFVVSIMPCTAKKFEATRPEMNAASKYWNNPNILRDVDVVLTSRELIKMIKEAGIDFANLPDQKYDPIMGESTGAGQIFGATGGVMEAALRTAYEAITGKTLPKLDFEAVRGIDGIKEATVEMNGLNVKVIVAHGLGNARHLLEKLKAGELKDTHFIEIMACPGGCIGGGGQPVGSDLEIREKRIQGIYERDKKLPLRKSHENPELLVLYEEFLKIPCGEISHKLLHTHYTPRQIK